MNYNDPYIPVIRPSQEYGLYAGRRAVEISRNFDLILNAKAYDEYRPLNLLSYGIPVADTRNMISVKYALCYVA